MLLSAGLVRMPRLAYRRDQMSSEIRFVWEDDEFLLKT